MCTQNDAETVQSPPSKENDTIASFVDNALVASPDSVIPTSAVYSRYCLWCRANGYAPDAQIAFRKKITTYAKITRRRPTGQPTPNPVSMILGYKFKEEN